MPYQQWSSDILNVMYGGPVMIEFWILLRCPEIAFNEASEDRVRKIVHFLPISDADDGGTGRPVLSLLRQLYAGHITAIACSDKRNRSRLATNPLPHIPPCH